MDLTIRPLSSAADLAACVDVQEAVWGRGFSEKVPAALLRVSLRVGAVLEGAFDEDGRLLGHVFGLTGLREGQPIHWSDMLAVRPEARDRGVGWALKLRQRAVLLERGVRVAEWTFDPLESRNAHLNFARLGGVAGEYIRDFYGGSDSPLHTGLATDRLIVTWRLDSSRVARRLAGDASIVESSHAERSASTAAAGRFDAPLINPVRVEGQHPSCDDARLDLGGDRVLLAIPQDIQAIKASAPDLAARWRAVTRAALEHYLGRGRVVTDFVRSDAWNAYVLAVGEAEEG